MLIMTHYPVDLMQYGMTSASKGVSLLESNTGLVKNKALLYTKYANYKQLGLPPIPFHPALLQLFGDAYMFKTPKPAIPRMLAEVAIVRKWTPVSSVDKMKRDIYLVHGKDAFSVDYIYEFF